MPFQVPAMSLDSTIEVNIKQLIKKVNNVFIFFNLRINIVSTDLKPFTSPQSESYLPLFSEPQEAANDSP